MTVRYHLTQAKIAIMKKSTNNKFWRRYGVREPSVSVQLLSHVWFFATPWTAERQASLSITNSRSPPKPMSTESEMTQSSHSLSFPSPHALNLSQHQGLFQWVSSLHQVAKLLEFQLRHQSFQWTPRTNLYDVLVGSPCSARDSQKPSPTRKFKSISFSALSFLYSLNLTWPLKKP